MAILARLAFGAPVALEDVAYEGITEIQPDDIAYAKELGLSLKLLGVAERRDGGISVRVFPCFLYPRHPLAPVEGPFNAVMVEAPAITEITMSGPGRGRDRDGVGGARRRRLDPLRPGARARRSREPLEIVRDIELVLLPPPRGRRPARRAGPDRRCARAQRGLGAKRRPAGLGDDARLVMVMHEGPETRFFAALEEIATLDFLRAAAPRDPGDRGGVRIAGCRGR